MSILKGISAAPFVMGCLLVVVTIPLVQNSNNSNKNLDKARKETVDPIRDPDPPEVVKSTDTAKERADRENRAEKAREKERARQNNKKRKEPPSPRP